MRTCHSSGDREVCPRECSVRSRLVGSGGCYRTVGHNASEGALEAASIAHRYRIDVVVGQETESAEGHVLGSWTPVRVRPGMSAKATVDAIHAQGGLAVAAHPFAPK